MLLANHSLEETMRFAEKVRKAFESYRFQVSGSDEAVTVSIGVAIWPDHGEALSEVLDAASKAEHLAKSGGRNTVREAAPRRAQAS